MIWNRKNPAGLKPAGSFVFGMVTDALKLEQSSFLSGVYPNKEQGFVVEKLEGSVTRSFVAFLLRSLD